MAITPTGHRILVDVSVAELKTDWGFDLSPGVDNRLENAAQIIGTLVAVGPQAWKAFGPDWSGEPWAQVGDRIMFSEWAGREVEDPETGKKYKLMNDEDVTAVITGEENAEKAEGESSKLVE